MTNNFDDKLDGSFTAGRIKRYAKITSAVGGLAAKLAGEKYCLLYTSPSPRDTA